MVLFSFISLFRNIGKLIKLGKRNKLDIKTLNLQFNPRYDGKKKWGRRPLTMIDKVITHQELAEGDTFSVYRYHISKECHLKPGVGAPSIAYHYTIEKNGTVYNTNPESAITWHCRGQNLTSIGIMLCGDFDGKGHLGRSVPTKKQLRSLDMLLDYLTSKFRIKKSGVYGHCDFGKLACPGFLVYENIKKYRKKA